MNESRGPILLITGEDSWGAVSEIEEYSEFVRKKNYQKIHDWFMNDT